MFAYIVAQNQGGSMLQVLFFLAKQNECLQSASGCSH